MRKNFNSFYPCSNKFGYLALFFFSLSYFFFSLTPFREAINSEAKTIIKETFTNYHNQTSNLAHLRQDPYICTYHKCNWNIQLGPTMTYIDGESISAIDYQKINTG